MSKLKQMRQFVVERDSQKDRATHHQTEDQKDFSLVHLRITEVSIKVTTDSDADQIDTQHQREGITRIAKEQQQYPGPENLVAKAQETDQGNSNQNWPVFG